MIDLFEYLDQQIIITDTEGKTWAGFCWGAHSAIENEQDEGVAEASLELYDGACSIVFYASEIHSIEVLD